jgi:hypothetical protein
MKIMSDLFVGRQPLVIYRGATLIPKNHFLIGLSISNCTSALSGNKFRTTKMYVELYIVFSFQSTLNRRVQRK